MKNLISSIFLHPFAVGLVCWLPLLGGCQKNQIGDDSNTIPLSEIPENPAFASLPLIGTKWKLVGFADGETGKIKLAESYSKNSYTLVFNEDSQLYGITSTNEVSGEFSNNPTVENGIIILSFGPKTYINEVYDGRLYINTMNEVFAFETTSKGLKLIYDENKYLLFNPIE